MLSSLRRSMVFMVFLLGCGSGPTWDSVHDMIQRDFPEVTHVSAEELATLIDAGDRAPTILDVREAEEFAVSHLSGAVRVSPGELPDFVAELAPDTPIVAYCSVGYRSSELAAKLAERGFTNVRNLDGSIFAWANAGRPMERDGEEVRDVHPYDDSWGRLLEPELRAYEPRESK